MAMSFKYKKVERPKPLLPLHTPSIPATLAGKGETLDVVALVDSGADITALPKGIAEILGLDLSGEREDVIGIGGKVPAVNSTCNIIIKGRGKHETYSFLLHVKVILEEKEDNFPVLLGRKDFFENFDITFKEKERRLILKKS